MKTLEPKVPKQPWRSPTLVYIGSIGEMLQQGGGKLSVVGGDPGESRKQKPDEPGG